MSDSILAALSSLSIEPAASKGVSHPASESQAGWGEALASLPASDAPQGYHLLKTLVFKPKTAKSETPLPVMVLTDESTQTNTSAIGAQLKLKDLRLAVPDLLRATLDASKDDGTSYVVLTQSRRSTSPRPTLARSACCSTRALSTPMWSTRCTRALRPRLCS